MNKNVRVEAGASVRGVWVAGGGGTGLSDCTATVSLQFRWVGEHRRMADKEGDDKASFRQYEALCDADIQGLTA